MPNGSAPLDIPGVDEAVAGEAWLYNSVVRPRGQVILDVGARDNSLFLDYDGEVHFFDPVPEFISALQHRSNHPLHHFNQFGLSDRSGVLPYFQHVESFSSRRKTLPTRWVRSCLTASPRRRLRVVRGDDYCRNAGVSRIGFLKIDVEGMELAVLRGFGDFLATAQFVQFEYGGTWLDTGSTLREAVILLREAGLEQVGYLSRDDIVPLQSLEDHYHYSNLVAMRVSDCVTFRT